MNKNKRSFDSAMELQAVQAGLVPAPVYTENKPKPQDSVTKEVFVHSNGLPIQHSGDAYLPSTARWGEPPPKPNKSVPVYQLVMSDILSRTDFGVKKYGTPLQANNGRDALKDAYEEALDLCMYLRQCIEERK